MPVPVNALQEIVLRLYGPQATGQVQPANVTSFSFEQLKAVLEPILNRHYVENVQITMAEAFGVKGRGKFYEETGVLRDVIQNHLLQVVSYVISKRGSNPNNPKAVDPELDKPCTR